MRSSTSTRDVLIQTDRPEEAKSFYEAVLGFMVFDENPQMRGLETGAFRLFLDPGSPLGPVMEFMVDDVQKMKVRLVAAGCSVVQEDALIPRCYIRDPFGLIFNLSQR